MGGKEIDLANVDYSLKGVGDKIRKMGEDGGGKC